MNYQIAMNWILEHEYADNSFSAGGIWNGLELDGVEEAEQMRRIQLYRQWRPTRKSALKARQAFYVVLNTELDPKDYPDLQPCGHLVTSIVQAHDGTAFCGECADKARYEQWWEGTQI